MQPPQAVVYFFGSNFYGILVLSFHKYHRIRIFFQIKQFLHCLVTGIHLHVHIAHKWGCLFCFLKNSHYRKFLTNIVILVDQGQTHSWIQREFEHLVAISLPMTIPLLSDSRRKRPISMDSNRSCSLDGEMAFNENERSSSLNFIDIPLPRLGNTVFTPIVFSRA